MTQSDINQVDINIENISDSTSWTIPDKSAEIPSNLPGEVRFAHMLNLLKVEKRTGWVNKSVPNPESIADHMYRMAVLSLIIPPQENIDMLKCTQMALVHDMAESLVGDITPLDNISKEEKHLRESKTMHYFQSNILNNSIQAQHLMNLYQEYEAGQTPEAKLVKDLDKYELALQTVEYERKHKINLSELIDSTRDIIQHPIIKNWAEIVYNERDQLWKEMN